MGMFDTDYTPSERPKLPTLKQYIASLPKKSKALQQSFLLEVVWLPGKFDNVTLQTHAFRISIRNDSPLYEEWVLLANQKEELDEMGAIGITVNDDRSGSFKLARRTEAKGIWKQIGSSGLRFDLLSA